MAASLGNVRFLSRTVLQAAKAQNRTCCRSFSRFSRQQKTASAVGAGTSVLVGAAVAKMNLTQKPLVDVRDINKNTDAAKAIKDIEEMYAAAVNDWRSNKETMFNSRQIVYSVYFLYDCLYLENKIDEKQLKQAQARIWNQLADWHLVENNFEQAEEYYKKALILLQESGNSLKGPEGLGAFRGLSLLYEKTDRADDSKKAFSYYKEQLERLSGDGKQEVLERGAALVKNLA